MKIRIISVLLSFSVFIGSLFFTNRAYASSPWLGAGTGLFQLAWQLIGIFSGEYDEAAEAIGYVLQEGWDGLTNPDSPFQTEWRSGWESICETLQSWFDSGDLNIEDETIKLSYEQMLELYSQVVRITTVRTVDFTCGYRYEFLSADLSLPISFDKLPRISEFFEFGGQSYSAVYFNDDSIVFPGWYINFESKNNDTRTLFYAYELLNSFGRNQITSLSSGCSLSDFFKNFSPSFYSPSLSHFQINYIFGGKVNEFMSDIQYCYVYNNGSLTLEPVSAVNISDMNSGLVTTTGDYPAFLKSISGITTSVKAPELDDPSVYLPEEGTVSFPVNPDLDVPIIDQIIVSAPDVPDVPISDVINGIDITIDTPSIIVKKFPFSLPFDLVRFFEVFAADPVPPVFKIPISTTLKNSGQWADNETLNGYINDDELMFEINKDITIDFAHIPLVQPICYTCFIVGFVFLLIHITSKMIQH